MKSKFGSIVTFASGGIGGQAFQPSKAGVSLRQKTSPKSQPSSSQSQVRAIFAAAAAAWRELTDNQRLTWANVSGTQSDAFQSFRSSYQNLLSAGLSTVLSYPGKINFPSVSIASFSVDALSGSVTLELSDPVQAGCAVNVFVTPILSAGVSNYSAKFRKLATLYTGQFGTIDLSEVFQNQYGTMVNRTGKIYVQTVTVLENTGASRVSDQAVVNATYVAPGSVGVNWTSLGQQFSQTYVLYLANIGNGIVLAGTYPDGLILRSTDYGLSWSNLGQQFGQSYIYSLANIGNGIVLAGTSPGGLILRSNDYGLTWSNLGQQFSQSLISSLANIGNGIVLAGTGPSGLILHSTDYGLTWSNLGQQFSQSYIYSLANIGNGIVLAGTSPGGLILRSTDYGLSWSNLGQQFLQSEILSIINISDGIVLAGTYPSGLILRSTDYGLSWSNLGQQFGRSYIYSLANIGNGIVLAGTYPDGLILRSTDYGLSWSNLGQQFLQYEVRSIINIGNGIVLAGTGAGGLILRSIPIN
ncbi:MAG: hypothetical protein WC297_03560 [Candidatus Paceibacterota bacterium]|jgi:photosystem II stability/assembly factor-like uncharacterized protein